jgi:hypothetical protein
MEAEVTIATDSGRSIEGIVPAQHRWLFTRRGEEGQPLLALHPDRNNDDYRRVTFLAEATRRQKWLTPRSATFPHGMPPIWNRHRRHTPTPRMASCSFPSVG